MRGACWLSRLFGVDEALMGDLMEEHHAGRPMLWLSWQMVMAIAARVASLLRHDPIRLLIAAGVAAVSAAVPVVWMHFLSHYVILLDTLWYPVTSNWLARSSPHTIWRAVMLLQPWMWTYQITFCVMLAAVAWCLVRAVPTRRHLVLGVFVLSNIAQCLGPLERIYLDWWRAPTNLVWISNLMVYVGHLSSSRRH